MLPNDTADNCQGERPIVLYAHGTDTDKNLNMADIESSENSEGLLIAAVFAAEGYIVVAPNYAGYDTSTLGYHPYLNGDQQSKDMIDALTAARSALPTADTPDTTASGELLVTGYSQGGYVAMATHRALQEAGETVTASAPMSGPYALSAGADAIFQGRVTGGSPVNLTLLLTSYQNAYGDIYATRRTPTSRSTPRTSKRCCRARRPWAISRTRASCRTPRSSTARRRTRLTPT